MVLFIFCFGGGVLVVVGVLWWFSSNSFEILYGSLWIEVLFFGFAGFPASLDGLANATAMVLSSSLWFLGWLWISVVSWSLELRITNILRHPPSTVGAWVWYLMLLKVDFVFLFFFVTNGIQHRAVACCPSWTVGDFNYCWQRYHLAGAVSIGTWWRCTR